MTRSSILRRLTTRLDLDRVVGMAIAVRLWQFLAGPLTIWLIGSRFTDAEQGYFYTFSSLLATQSFFELGLQGVLVNLTSHEWARGTPVSGTSGTSQEMEFNEQQTRLASLLRLTTRWYSICAVAFAAIIGPAGFFMLRAHGSTGLWELPWCVLVPLTAIALWLAPLTSFLIGCNQVATVSKFRLCQAVIGNLAVWGAIASGAGLWTPVVAVLVQIGVEACLIGVRFRRLFVRLFRTKIIERMEWKTEIWPLQWRIGIQSVAYWFGFQAFTPVMLHHYGEKAAGQMGMTWTILMAIQGVSMAWMQTRLPLFGQLIARREFAELDRHFRNVVAVSSAAIVSITLAYWGTVCILNDYKFALADRMLEPLPTALLCGGLIANHLATCAGTYVRAHNRDPFLLAATSSSLLMAVAVWSLGKWFGAVGVGSAYLGIVSLYLLPLHLVIWRNARQCWH
jgi:O-antigen/teichoic acid export membrane protein